MEVSVSDGTKRAAGGPCSAGQRQLWDKGFGGSAREMPGNVRCSIALQVRMARNSRLHLHLAGPDLTCVEAAFPFLFAKGCYLKLFPS